MELESCSEVTALYRAQGAAMVLRKILGIRAELDTLIKHQEEQKKKETPRI